MARRPTRAERNRNKIIMWWGAAILLGVFAWNQGRVELWILPILVIAYYELCAVPTLCGVETSRGHPCKNQAYGRLIACKDQPSHAVYKNDALLRMLGFRRPPRQVSAPAPGPHDRTATELPMEPQVATIESKQTLITLLTVVGTIAGVVQVFLAAKN
ncbi:hypothetical protein [Spirillospora sp. NPDC047279]|uniref:hypothetical protein n=1 Tax=Spirillospora sp. NPDC047279 TaxID=3155478 RepID=UPI0033D7ADCE